MVNLAIHFFLLHQFLLFPLNMYFHLFVSSMLLVSTVWTCISICLCLQCFLYQQFEHVFPSVCIFKVYCNNSLNMYFHLFVSSMLLVSTVWTCNFVCLYLQSLLYEILFKTAIFLFGFKCLIWNKFYNCDGQSVPSTQGSLIFCKISIYNFLISKEIE